MPGSMVWGRRMAGMVAAVLVALAAASSASAAPCGTPGNNEIVVENCKTGNPASDWDVSGAGDPSIQGFATDISVAQGETVHFKVDTTASDYRLDIYRMGYYGGAGARFVATVQPSVALPQGQPGCGGDAATGLVDCGNWSESASWPVPADATSGIYFAKLVRESGAAGASHVVFIVRDDDGASDLLFQTSDTTWQAYNTYGGNSLYSASTPAGRAYKVSYNRPFDTRGNASGEDWVFNSEYPMVRWLERNGYDVSYFTGVDSDRRGAEIREHRTFLSVGHDEYWSGAQRANVEAARDAGVNLAFFSGNEVFWKTRWENGNRTLVTYKETSGDATDPTGTWTGTWRDPRPFNPEGGKPENALTGTIFTVNSGAAALRVPAADGKLRLWRGTAVAGQAAGGVAALTDETVGYEWDEDLDNGARPAGLVRLSSTTVSGVDKLQDYGWTYAPGTATHSLTLYRATNGAGADALVFGAGTVQWSWGLDADHDRGGPVPDASMEQATVNLLADMSAQPGSLQAGLAVATPSSDTTAPTSMITSRAGGATAEEGAPITMSGTAADAGGRVGGVEVSVDNGASWHPATGREAWTYTWTPAQSGGVTLLSRAADDSGNLGAASAEVSVTVGGTDQTAPRVTTVVPAVDNIGVDTATRVSATFDEALDPSTVSSATFQLRNSAGATVPASVGYTATTRTATLTPTEPLAASTRYTAMVTTGVEDVAGNALVQPRMWSFTTAAAQVTPNPGGEPTPGLPGTGVPGIGAPDAGLPPGTPPGATLPSSVDRVAPRVRVSPVSTRVSRSGTAKLRVACPAGERSCRVTLRLQLAGHDVATRTLTVLGGTKRSFMLKLSRGVRRTLLRKRSLRVTAIAAARDLAGNHLTTRTRIRLLAPEGLAWASP